MVLRLFIALVLVFPPQLWSSRAYANEPTLPVTSPVEVAAPIAEAEQVCPVKILGNSPESVRNRVLAAMESADAETTQLHAVLDNLISEAGKVAEECHSKTAGQCASLGAFLKNATAFGIPLRKGIGAEWKAQDKHGKTFAQTFFREIIDTFTPKNLKVPFLWTKDNPADPKQPYATARANYMKTLAWVLLFQFSTHFTHVFTNPEYKWEVIFPILANTLIMITLQTQKGIAHTEQELGLPDPATFRELNNQLPAMLSGTDGFKVEAKAKYAAFLSLFPIEVAFMFLADSMREWVSPNGPVAFAKDTPTVIILSIALSLAVFGNYLSARWATFDYWFNLRYLPAFQKLNKNLAANTQRQIDHEMLQLLESHGAIKKPAADSSFTYFRKALGIYILGPGKDVPAPTVDPELPPTLRPSWFQTTWSHRRAAVAQMRQEWTVNNENLKAWEAQYGAQYRQAMATPEAKDLKAQSRAAWRGAKTTAALESAYRFGLNFIDAYIIFGLMGSWVPKAVNAFLADPSGFAAWASAPTLTAAAGLAWLYFRWVKPSMQPDSEQSAENTLVVAPVADAPTNDSLSRDVREP